MVSAIAAEGLTKFYGSHCGVDDLDLVVEDGAVFGFLGPNGAGKTTTIRLLLDLIRPTRGTVRVLGLDPRADGIRLRGLIGYVPGEFGLYERMTGEAFLGYFDNLRGGGHLARARVLADRLDLDVAREIGQMSRGNKQKVALVQAFMHEPRLLVLDEPTSGLDPLVQREFRLLVREAVTAGATVFLSSHVLHEVQHIADRVGILRDGRLVAVEDVGRIGALALRRVTMRFEGPVPADRIAAVPCVSDIEVEGQTLHCRVRGDFDAFVKTVARYHVADMTSEEADLEDVFFAFYREGEREDPHGRAA